MSDEPGPPRRRRPRAYGTGGGRRPRHWTDYLPITAAILFLLACAVVLVGIANWLAPAGAPVAVPRFIGMSLEHATAQADQAQLRLHIIARRPDYHARKDVIVGQLPEAGEHVRSGRSIDIIVSDGIPIVKTPNLSNMSLRDAQLSLENAHLELGEVQEQTNPDVIAGQVLEQHPDPFAGIQAGSKVNVVVGKGRALLYTPNFSGLSIDFVKQAAHEANIQLGDLRYLPIALGAKPKGTVVAQEPPPGQILNPKQKVALQISGGAPATPTPSPSPSESPSPLETLAPEATPTIALPSPVAPRLMRVSVALPASATPQPVRVVLQDATGSRTLYNHTTAGGITLSFDVTVSGAATIETYASDRLISTTPL